MGLSISKELVEMMGGKIHVESELNKGSHFNWYVPLCERKDIHAADTASSPEKTTPSYIQSGAEYAHVLVVEDHPVNQLLIKKLLAKLGYNDNDMVFVENGKEALQKMGDREFALILMDCQMPEMDGYETTGWIRKLEEGSGMRVPIIAMTAMWAA